MANSREYVDYIVDRLGPIGDVLARPMFGGHGLFMDGLMLAIISADTLYLKVDDETRDRYRAEGLLPFKPSAERPKTMSYYPLPEAVFEDQDELVEWAREAFAVAMRGRPKSTPRRSRTPGR